MIAVRCGVMARSNSETERAAWACAAFIFTGAWGWSPRIFAQASEDSALREKARGHTAMHYAAWSN